MVVISRELKNKFIEFCKQEFKDKSVIANEKSKTQWFFVQAGNNFGNKLHYELCKGQVQLHIEIEDSMQLQGFIFERLRNPNFEWRFWNKPNHCCAYNRILYNEKEVFDAFCEIRNTIEPIIKEFENQQIKDDLDIHQMNNVELYTKTLGQLLQIIQDTSTENHLDFPLSIPDYQRIYCWTEKNVHKLLDDIVESAEKKYPYHLGSVILHKSSKSENEIVYSIVDGQQRLVTLSLLLLQLGNDTSPLLNERFESTEAQDYIAYNKTLIGNYLKLNPDKIRIKNLLNNLKFSVLIINDGSLDLAYTFFSNQNSRGKSLTDYDLLKAHHLRFVHIEKQAIHLAERWDNMILNSGNDESDKELGRTFGIYLFRMRKWMRKNQWSENQKFKVKTEFEAASTIADVPPFGEQFHFYESIQGGAHFFAYSDHYIYKFRSFSQTPQFGMLDVLNNESHWWYRDAIETLFFAYYLKFGSIYMSEALYCIERIISEHRYGYGRSSLRAVLEHASNSEIVMMIDQATSPTFFLAECLNKIKKLVPNPEIKGIQERYKSRATGIHSLLKQTMCVDSIIGFSNKKSY